MSETETPDLASGTRRQTLVRTDTEPVPSDIRMFEVKLSPNRLQPILIDDGHFALSLAVAPRESVHNLDATWDTAGVYLLLSRQAGEDWSVYVGKASDRGLKARVKEHQKNKPDWRSAILMRRNVDGWFNAAHIAWLERALYLALRDAPNIHLDNQNTPPGDQSITESVAVTLQECASQILLVAQMQGLIAKPSGASTSATPSATQVPSLPTSTPSALTANHSHTIPEMLANGTLIPNETLYPLPVKPRAEGKTAHVLPDGGIEYAGVRYTSPSAAGKIASGWRECNGWKFWSVQRSDGLVSLATLPTQAV